MKKLTTDDQPILVAQQTADITMKAADPSLTPAEAAEKLSRLGNPILSINDITGDILVAHVDPDPILVRWVCDFCGAHSVDYDRVVAHELTCERRPHG